MRITIIALLLAASVAGSLTPANAQQGRTADPNLRNFYMARQQVTITDDSPIINDQRSMQGPAGGGAGVGGMQVPVGLPKAGWQPYSSSIPGVRTALPQVNNGVPKALPAGNNSKGLSGNAGKLKPQTAAAPRPSGPVTVQGYKAYKGYGGSLTPSSPAPTAGYGSSYGGGSSTQTNVQGSVLHWARKKY